MWLDPFAGKASAAKRTNSVVTRRVFSSQNSQERVGDRGYTPDPPIPWRAYSAPQTLAGLRGKVRKGRFRKGEKRERRGRQNGTGGERRGRGEEVGKGVGRSKGWEEGKRRGVSLPASAPRSANASHCSCVKPLYQLSLTVMFWALSSGNNSCQRGGETCNDHSTRPPRSQPLTHVFQQTHLSLSLSLSLSLRRTGPSLSRQHQSVHRVATCLSLCRIA